MGRLIKFEVVSMPKLYVVGKSIKLLVKEKMIKEQIRNFWANCLKDGTLALIEEQSEYIFDPSYVGFSIGSKDGYVDYYCGMIMKNGVELPDPEYKIKQLDKTDVAVGWIQGKSLSDINLNAFEITEEKMKIEGYRYTNEWSMEVFNCPRFTHTDDFGDRILDYYLPCYKK